ncbi:hypothetical protein [Sphingomonas bacterium]|uniref:hypothetical protein n=1 Tax=Sphingomonas bacterium TaxID=1895847 RepID=UPI0026281863|nr:hypothetical protein [Sphingomonas bacterium]MDB5677030.1 hypothetical protein [Sphingomonas bacterium]
MADRNHGWALIGLATLGSIGGGVLMGQQASADMAPFYANLSATIPDDAQSNGVKIVSSDGARTRVETADLSYRRATTDGMQEPGY